MVGHTSHMKNGFTIIEVVLVLAITGLMLIGAFTAVRSSTNNQSYTTAVTGLLTYFQNQYNAVLDVQNDRAPSTACTSGTVTTGNATTTSPGTGSCTIIGRMIVVTSPTELTSYPVYATSGITPLNATTSAYNCTTNVLASTCANAVIDTTQSQTYPLAWLASLETAKGAATTSLALVIYRSPVDGQIGMQWSATPLGSSVGGDTYIQNQFLPGNPSATALLTLCVDHSGFTTIPTMGVTIDPTAIGSSGGIARTTSNGGGCSNA